MQERITVEVKQPDIDHGVCEDPNECAVAQAISRLFPGAEVSVGQTHASIWIEDEEGFDNAYGQGWSYQGEWRLPEYVAEFIQQFDNGVCVGPMSFTMRKVR